MEWTKEERYRPYSAMSKTEESRLLHVVDHAPWRQHYHIQPPTGLLNDPNGFCFYNGQYHLFYQWFPYGAVHGLKHWYHTTSTNLVLWQGQGVAIEPEESFESHGAYSGSGIVVDEQLYLLYTGNERDSNWERTPNQCLAIMKQTAASKNYLRPLSEGSPPGYTEHVRDPKVWQKNDQYYFVIGAQREDITGCALLYSSTDLLDWTLVGEINTSLGKFGYMWECPDYFELDSHGVLLFCPQGLEAKGDAYRNIFQSGYILGSKLNVSDGSMSHGPFRELDHGFDFYAPQTTTRPDGRRILIGWMGLPDRSVPTERDEWAHCLTIPRELTISGDRLLQNPVAELTTQRGASTHFSDTTTRTFGHVYEAYVTFTPVETSSTYGINMRTSESEQTVLTYDMETKQLTLDRSLSGEVPATSEGTTRTHPYTLPYPHVFMDHSSVEIFVNGGEAVFTSRIFPSEDATGFNTFTNDTNVTIQGTQWEIL
ncbi:LOW QUALITY PROTEIN: sucrose-6-phosphate hydrolase [Geomicrobium sp. JCM 19039]|nr:LOW QUALITY PROTEIN: sucrose-6-phosphate hydrolase [Geomicrobium sp. JCM 19039]